MLPHHTTLQAFLKKKTKQELIELISDSYQLAHGKLAWDLFDKLIYEYHIKNLDAVELQQYVETFYAASLKGKYYSATSKNMIPEQTDIWFSELSLLLDLSCGLVFKGEHAAARVCFDRLFKLIDHLADDKIVFAPECGEWMITCRCDYRNVYQSLLAH